MALFTGTSFMSALCAAVCITLAAPLSALAETPIRNGETFGNWIFECIALGEGQTACGLSQTIVANEGADVLAKITFGREEATNNLILSTLLPLSLDLTQPMALQTDGGSIGIVVLSCVPSGCFGRSVLTEVDIGALVETTGLSISLQSFGESELAMIPASAEGLREGLERANYLR